MLILLLVMIMKRLYRKSERRAELEQQLDEVIKDHFSDAAEGVIFLANWFYDECISYNIDKVYKGFYLTKDMKEFNKLNKNKQL